MTQYSATSGSPVSNTTINSGDALYVYAGGTATGNTVDSGGTAVVYSGGTALGNVESGNVSILSGGFASGNIVNVDGDQVVSVGGTASGTVVHADGFADVYGTDVATTLSGSQNFVGAAEVVESGGVASGTTVRSGGFQGMNSGGSTIGTAVFGGGIEHVEQGTASGTTVYSGGQIDEGRGGIATGTVVSAGGTDNVGLGALDPVFSGASPLAVGAIISSGGTQIVSSGGIASGTIVSSGGRQYVSSGGSASGTTVISGGTEVVSSGGATISTDVNGPNSVENVYGNGTASGTVVSGYTGGSGTPAVGGTENVYAGGTAIAAVVYNFGQVIDEGGTSINTDLAGPDAAETVEYGGTAINTAVGPFGNQFIYYSGVASGTTLSGYGLQRILSGGQAIGTSANNNSEIDVHSGGIVTNAVLSSSSEAFISAGGSANGVTVSEDSLIYVFSGGGASGITVGALGIEGLFSGSSVSSTSMTSGGQIDLTFMGYVSGSPGPTLDQNDILHVTEGGSSYQQQLVGDYAGEYFHAAQDGYSGTGSGTVITLDNNPCYCRNTKIATPTGESSAEALRIGEMVVTHSGVPRPIKWIGHRAYDPRFIAGNRNILPIVFKAGALADGVPVRDLHVSPKHAMFLNDVLIPAERLLNGRSVVQLEAVSELTYFHIELETHDILLAEGAPSESFVDCDSRNMFRNAHEFAALYPGSSGESWRFCAERVESGPHLEAARALLAARADALGLPSIASQTLHLTTGGTVTTTVAAGTVELSFRSPSKIPAGEYRRLGAAFTALRLDGVAIDLDHPSLGRGFHPTEREDGRVWRWSDGEGVLRIEPAPHPRELTISLDCVLSDALDCAA